MSYLEVTLAVVLLLVAASLSAQADDAAKRADIYRQAAKTAGELKVEWQVDLPVVAVPERLNASSPLAIVSPSGTVTVAAESAVADGIAIVLSQSSDGGRNWGEPREIARGAAGKVMSAGAGGALPSGRLVLAVQAWSDRSGSAAWVREEPKGTHHYSWSGAWKESRVDVLISDDDGKTWTKAACDTSGGPVAPAAMGRVFAANGAAWFAVYGPADAGEMDLALSSIGLMKSTDGGRSWKFNHWVARADKTNGIGYGRGEIVVLPDGRWVGMIEAQMRDRGDYAKPRIFRTISRDKGKTWSKPGNRMIGPAGSTIVLDKGRLMVGSKTTSAGVSFSIFADAGESVMYQDHVWRGFRTSGPLQLAKLTDGTILCFYTWKKMGGAQSEIHVQALHSKAPPEANLSRTFQKTNVRLPKWRWVMAEGYQLPDIADAPAGLRMRSLLELRSGDWMCIGYTGTTDKGEGLSYGFGASGLAVMRAPAIEGPWKKVVDVPVPEEVGGVHDPGTGMGMPSFLWQHSSGRLFLPFSGKGRVDNILTYSDDEGKIWRNLGSMAKLTGLPDIQEADMMVEAKDGSIVYPLVTGSGGSPGDPKSGATLAYIRSYDKGLTWSKPVFWARWKDYPPTPYEGLPYGNVGEIRETAMTIVNDRMWLATHRGNLGSPVEVQFDPTRGEYVDYLAYGQLMMARSEDGGKTWKPGFGMVFGEPAMATAPDGTVFLAHRQLDHASVWMSYNKGASWQLQEDPAEVPGQHGQWPPGGESTIRVLDANTVVVITDTGLVPSGMTLPPDFKGTRELYGRAMVRYFRRVPAPKQ